MGMQTDHKQIKVLVPPCAISIYMENVSESLLIHKVSGLYHFKDFTLSKGKLLLPQKTMENLLKKALHEKKM